MGVLNVSKSDQVNYVKRTSNFIKVVVNSIQSNKGKLKDEDFKVIFDEARGVVSSNLGVTQAITRIVNGVQMVPIKVGARYVVRFQFERGQITKANIYDEESKRVIKISRELMTQNGRGSVKYAIETDTYQVIQGVRSA